MYLTVGKDSENVQLGVRSKALTLPHARYNSSHKGAMAQTYKQKYNNCSESRQMCTCNMLTDTGSESRLENPFQHCFSKKQIAVGFYHHPVSSHWSNWSSL